VEDFDDRGKPNKKSGFKDWTSDKSPPEGTAEVIYLKATLVLANILHTPLITSSRLKG
jgi:hypothetical protein